MENRLGYVNITNEDKVECKTKIKFSKIREVKSPVRSDELASGIDFFIPEFTDNFIDCLREKNPTINSIKPDAFEYYINRNDNSILLGSGSSILIPSGIKVRGKKGITLNANNKSGVGSKKQLDRLAEVVDANYQGEIHISLTNTSNFMMRIFSGEKIIQFLQLPVIYDVPEEVEIMELFNEESERGENGFGSSN